MNAHYQSAIFDSNIEQNIKEPPSNQGFGGDV